MYRTTLAAVAAVLALGATAPAAVAQQAAPPPIEAYASLPALEQLAISPNGERLVYVRQDGAERVMGIQTVGGEALGVTRLGAQKVRDIFWADDDHVVITTSSFDAVGMMASSTEQWNAQIYSVPNRRFVTVLNTTSGSGGSTASTRIGGGTGSLNILAGAPFIRQVDGETRLFARSFDREFRVQTFEIDLETGDGRLRESYRGIMGPDGRAVATADRDRDTGRWWINARDGVGQRQIWTGEGYMIDTPSLLGYGRTADTVLFSVPGAARDEIYEVPLAGGEAERLNFGDYGEPSPIYHPEDGRLLGFFFTGENSYEYVFLDQQAGRAWASVQAAFPNALLSMVSATPDYMKMIVRTDGGRDTGTYHLVDLTSGRAVRIGSAYPAVPAESVGEVRFINYAAADGMNIPAYLTLPAGRDPQDLPLIVMPHGGPQARDMPGFEYWAQLLASRGYAVLQPQFRGSTGFGNAHLEAGYAQWGRKMQTDLSDGVRHLASEGLIDPQRVCIWGWSYGGYAAMAGPTIDPGVYRCAAAGAGVSDLPAMLSWSREQTGSRDSDTMRYWRRFMGVDANGQGSLDEISPARMAQHADVPILLIHGRDDSVVPYEQTEIFARALERAGKDVEVVDIRGDDHWLSTAAGRLQVFQSLVPFLEEHNPPYQ